MIVDIDSIKQQILHSDELITLIRQQITHCSQFPALKEESKEEYEEVKLAGIVEEVTRMMGEITELALEEENSHNYLSFINKTQMMMSELEKKIMRELQTALEGITSDIEQIKKDIKKINLEPPKIKSQSSKLKDQRKLLTRKIIEEANLGLVRSKLNLDQNSTVQTELRSPFKENQVSILSHELERSISQEKENSKAIPDLNKRIEALQLEHAKVEEKLLDEISVISSRVQAGLEGVWNILSDLSTRLGRYEAESISLQQST